MLDNNAAWNKRDDFLEPKFDVTYKIQYFDLKKHVTINSF